MQNVKKIKANSIINSYAVAAGAIAITPIPFSDATLLIPTQTLMIVKLYNIYGKSITKGAVKGMLNALTTTTVARTFVGNVIKFIPGVGTVVGGVITTTVAYSFTKAMGKVILEGLENDTLDNSGDLKKLLKTGILLNKKSK